jgi:hypothetical protein
MRQEETFMGLSLYRLVIAATSTGKPDLKAGFAEVGLAFYSPQFPAAWLTCPTGQLCILARPQTLLLDFGQLLRQKQPESGLLQLEFARIARLKDLRDNLASQGAEPIGNSDKGFSALIRADIDKWKKLFKSTRIVAD